MRYNNHPFEFDEDKISDKDTHFLDCLYALYEENGLTMEEFLLVVLKLGFCVINDIPVDDLESWYD